MAAIISSYNTLVSAVVEFAEDDSAEFLTYLPTAIGLAETKLARAFDTFGLTMTQQTTVSSGTSEVAKPSDWRLSYDLWIDTSAGRKMMRSKTRSWVVDYWPDTTSTGVPKYYAQKSDTSIMVAPTNASAYVYNFVYSGQPTALSSANQTNYFTDKTPDALFHGTLVEMADFSRNSEMLAEQRMKWKESIDSLMNEARRQRRDDGSHVGRGNTNTIIEGSN